MGKKKRIIHQILSHKHWFNKVLVKLGARLEVGCLGLIGAHL